MKRINKMITHTVIQIFFWVFICFLCFTVFNDLNLMEVQEKLFYTNIEVVQNKNAYIAIDEFTNEEQLTINIINESNSYENYNILLTSEINLEEVDEHIYIKIDDVSYSLEELLLKDNHYHIMSGKLKADNKQVKIFLAIDNEYADVFKDDVNFSFVNENTLI